MDSVHFQEADALEAVNQALERAKEVGKFMVAVWTPREDGQVTMQTRTTWQFPVEQLPRCVDVLYQSVADELRPKPAPLPMSPMFASFTTDVNTDLPQAILGRDEDNDDG